MDEETKDVNFSNSDEQISKAAGKIKRTRNLQQYKNLSDEEFKNAMAQKALGIEISEEFEKRINKKLEEFGEDYDLSDLKINDRETLRALIQAIISLEDYEQYQYKVRSGGISNDVIFSTKEVQKIMSDLRADISKGQNDLNITRKIRKSDQDVSVQAYIDGLKEKAKRFYEAKAGYIFCPKCNMLLGTVWVQYADQERNKIALVCGRHLDNGEVCGEKITVSIKELMKNRGTNNKAITPESML